MSTAQRITALERRHDQAARLDRDIQRELDKMTPAQEAAFLADFTAEFGKLLDDMTPESQDTMRGEWVRAGWA